MFGVAKGKRKNFFFEEEEKKKKLHQKQRHITYQAILVAGAAVVVGSFIMQSCLKSSLHRVFDLRHSKGRVERKYGKKTKPNESE